MGSVLDGFEDGPYKAAHMVQLHDCPLLLADLPRGPTGLTCRVWLSGSIPQSAFLQDGLWSLVSHSKSCTVSNIKKRRQQVSETH